MKKTKEFLKRIRDYSILSSIEEREKTLIFPDCLYFYKEMKDQTLSYIDELRISPCRYRFSRSAKAPTLYASVFAFMLQAWFSNGTVEFREEWINYFNSFQRDDGLFTDIREGGGNPIFENGDGWGARHLAGHMIIVYAKLGILPDKEFKILEFLKNPDAMLGFLDQLDFYNMSNGNKIMNYGILLQYSRDFFGMNQYKDSIDALEEWLVKHINPQTGLWNNHEKVSLQEWTNLSYHLWPILNYDNIEVPYAKKAIDTILENQNKFGGFSAAPISSACSDIDAIEPLIRLSALNNHYRDQDIRKAISKAYSWVMLNKESNGYMFEYGRPFTWGRTKKINLFSKKGEANIFATWFRLLSIIYMNHYLGVETCKLMKIPGYEMPIINETI